MAYQLDDFQAQLNLAIGKFYTDPNEATELNAIRIALGGDATTGDVTLQIPPSGLKPGNPFNSPFVNEILKLINRGKGGNLSTIAMANIIGGIVASPPQNVTAPTMTYVTGGSPGAGTVGATYSNAFGTWNPPVAQLTMSRQWLSGGAQVGTAATYTFQASDVGNMVLCAVTGTSLAGSTTANSNGVIVS